MHFWAPLGHRFGAAGTPFEAVGDLFCHRSGPFGAAGALSDAIGTYSGAGWDYFLIPLGQFLASLGPVLQSVGSVRAPPGSFFGAAGVTF